MNRQQLDKALWNLVECIKLVTMNDIDALKAVFKDLSNDELNKLKSLVKLSIDSGYSRGYSTFMRSISAKE